MEELSRPLASGDVRKDSSFERDGSENTAEESGKCEQDERGGMVGAEIQAEKNGGAGLDASRIRAMAAVLKSPSM